MLIRYTDWAEGIEGIAITFYARPQLTPGTIQAILSTYSGIEGIYSQIDDRKTLILEGQFKQPDNLLNVIAIYLSSNRGNPLTCYPPPFGQRVQEVDEGFSKEP